MTAKDKASNFEAGHVAEVGCRRNEIGELSKQLREHVATAAAGSTEFSAVYAELELQQANADSLDAR